jgi:DNA-binding transcriptional LysR family regulator
MSVPNFLVIPDIVARSDMVALVPSRLVEGRAARLWVLAPPLPVGGFSISMLWHERTTSHPAQRWLREKLLGLVA